ncbi:hypothetical protein IGB42_03879 [Andreprevotia sp. IGB-42]|uniref:site-2 protease family protein n=1 Tax=Andreprevotia sp. IGB-42 TaxID=2497473 RepID=UPI001358E38A|nr:site-2 protease family protein [Andreprevotia sp. IGB-42]KAF0811590.1 hypothetical protein IGB42_03879 [Andreprevotia sp. IGB-42]
MNDLIELLPWLFIALLFTPLPLLLVLFYNLLQVVEYPCITQIDDQPLVQQADEQVAVDELAALGFSIVRHGSFSLASLSRRWVLFRHENQIAFASLMFSLGHGGSYPVTFCSFTAEGTALLTHNRLLHLLATHPAGIEAADPYADSLQAHWQAHLARLEGRSLKRPDDEEICRLALQQWQDAFPARVAAGMLVQRAGAWFYTVRQAWRMAWNTARVRRKMAKPYLSALSGSPHIPEFYTCCSMQLAELQLLRGNRPYLNLLLLLGTGLVALLGWALYANWQTGLALIIILLVHEAGHALAMRLFGYGDVKMFFLPFLGAVVTGQPKSVAAWKQAVMYLAGPLPGLIAGVVLLLTLGPVQQALPAVNWHLVASMAVFINLFNLLPVTPLDGGRLVELALLQRWPWARLAFTLLSAIGMAVAARFLQAPLLWVLPVFLLLGIRQQWRQVQLMRMADRNQPEDAQLLKLFTHARQLAPQQPFAKLNALVRGVLASHKVHTARWWESCAIVLLLIAPWSVAAWAVYDAMWTRTDVPQFTEQPAPRQRTQLQREFDAYFEDEEDNYDLEPAKWRDRHQQLAKIAAKLPADDPRQVDLAVDQVAGSPVSERVAALDAILASGKQGEFNGRDVLVQMELQYATASYGQEPAQQVQTLQAALANIEHLAPGRLLATLDTRIALAHAKDLAGDSPAAQSMLVDLLGRAEVKRDPDAYDLVGSKLTWFHIAHQQYGKAQQLQHQIRQFGNAQPKPWRRFNADLDLAWLQLLSGDKATGLATMGNAAYSHPKPPRLSQRLLGVGYVRPHLRLPADMAYALAANGQTAEARALLGKTDWECRLFQEHETYRDSAPWQQARTGALFKTLKELCPQAVAGKAVGPAIMMMAARCAGTATH